MDAILQQKDLHLIPHTLNNVNEEILFPSFVINSKSKTSALSQTIQMYRYHTIPCFLQGLGNGIFQTCSITISWITKCASYSITVLAGSRLEEYLLSSILTVTIIVYNILFSLYHGFFSSFFGNCVSKLVNLDSQIVFYLKM